jgi:hypothetical protein
MIKAMANMDKEIELYPDNRKEIPVHLMEIAGNLKKDEGAKILPERN